MWSFIRQMPLLFPHLSSCCYSLYHCFVRVGGGRVQVWGPVPSCSVDLAALDIRSLEHCKENYFAISLSECMLWASPSWKALMHLSSSWISTGWEIIEAPHYILSKALAIKWYNVYSWPWYSLTCYLVHLPKVALNTSRLVLLSKMWPKMKGCCWASERHPDSWPPEDGIGPGG